jgi:hypothetical protein
MIPVSSCFMIELWSARNGASSLLTMGPADENYEGRTRDASGLGGLCFFCGKSQSPPSAPSPAGTTPGVISAAAGRLRARLGGNNGLTCRTLILCNFMAPQKRNCSAIPRGLQEEEGDVLELGGNYRATVLTAWASDLSPNHLKLVAT